LDKVVGLTDAAEAVYVNWNMPGCGIALALKLRWLSWISRSWASFITPLILFSEADSPIRTFSRLSIFLSESHATASALPVISGLPSSPQRGKKI